MLSIQNNVFNLRFFKFVINLFFMDLNKDTIYYINTIVKKFLIFFQIMRDKFRE